MEKEEIVFYLNKTLNNYEMLSRLGATTDAKTAVVLDALSENLDDVAELVQEFLQPSATSNTSKTIQEKVATNKKKPSYSL
jgi:hypothetical protein